MITQLTAVITDLSGNSKSSHTLFSHGRLHIKSKTPKVELPGNCIRHLEAMPCEFTVEIRISGSEEALRLLAGIENGFENNGSLYIRPPVLTQQEFKLLKLLNEGKTLPEISAILNITYQSVRNLAHSLYNKLHCSSAVEAGAAGRRLNLVG